MIPTVCMVDADAESILKASGRARTRRRRSLLVASAAIIAVVGLAIGAFLVGNESSYRATAQVVLVPGAETAPDLIPSAWESLTGERATTMGCRDIGRTPNG